MALATTAQVQRINQLIADSKLTTEQVQKILKTFASIQSKTSRNMRRAG